MQERRDAPAPNIVRGQRVQAVKLQRAKELRRQMTGEEAILWRELRTNRFHGVHFRRQQVIDGFIADFYCHSRRLVIEVDGPVHERRADYDAERDRILASHGLSMVRVTNEEVRRNLAAVLARIAEAARVIGNE